jgi:hypothetical protein
MERETRGSTSYCSRSRCARTWVWLGDAKAGTPLAVPQYHSIALMLSFVLCKKHIRRYTSCAGKLRRQMQWQERVRAAFHDSPQSSACLAKRSFARISYIQPYKALPIYIPGSTPITFPLHQPATAQASTAQAHTHSSANGPPPNATTSSALSASAQSRGNV